VQVAEGEGVHADGRDRQTTDGRPAGRDPHLLDDVGETLVETVVGIKRLGVHGARQMVAGADPRHEPVEDGDSGGEDKDKAHSARAEREDLEVPVDAGWLGERLDNGLRRHHDDPDAQVDHEEQQGKQRPHTPASFALDLEHGLGNFRHRHHSPRSLSAGVART
jgi:hypothetical protein